MSAEGSDDELAMLYVQPAASPEDIRQLRAEHPDALGHNADPPSPLPWVPPQQPQPQQPQQPQSLSASRLGPMRLFASNLDNDHDHPAHESWLVVHEEGGGGREEGKEERAAALRDAGGLALADLQAPPGTAQQPRVAAEGKERHSGQRESNHAPDNSSEGDNGTGVVDNDGKRTSGEDGDKEHGGKRKASRKGRQGIQRQLTPGPKPNDFAPCFPDSNNGGPVDNLGESSVNGGDGAGDTPVLLGTSPLPGPSHGPSSPKVALSPVLQHALKSLVSPLCGQRALPRVASAASMGSTGPPGAPFAPPPSLPRFNSAPGLATAASGGDARRSGGEPSSPLPPAIAAIISGLDEEERESAGSGRDAEEGESPIVSPLPLNQGGSSAAASSERKTVRNRPPTPLAASTGAQRFQQPGEHTRSLVLGKRDAAPCLQAVAEVDEEDEEEGEQGAAGGEMGSEGDVGAQGNEEAAAVLQEHSPQPLVDAAPPPEDVALAQAVPLHALPFASPPQQSLSPARSRSPPPDPPGTPPNDGPIPELVPQVLAGMFAASSANGSPGQESSGDGPKSLPPQRPLKEHLKRFREQAKPNAANAANKAISPPLSRRRDFRPQRSVSEPILDLKDYDIAAAVAAAVSGNKGRSGGEESGGRSAKRIPEVLARHLSDHYRRTSQAPALGNEAASAQGPVQRHDGEAPGSAQEQGKKGSRVAQGLQSVISQCSSPKLKPRAGPMVDTDLRAQSHEGDGQDEEWLGANQGTPSPRSSAPSDQPQPHQQPHQQPQQQPQQQLQQQPQQQPHQQPQQQPQQRPHQQLSQQQRPQEALQAMGSGWLSALFRQPPAPIVDGSFGPAPQAPEPTPGQGQEREVERKPAVVSNGQGDPANPKRSSRPPTKPSRPATRPRKQAPRAVSEGAERRKGPRRAVGAASGGKGSPTQARNPKAAHRKALPRAKSADCKRPLANNGTSRGANAPRRPSVPRSENSALSAEVVEAKERAIARVRERSRSVGELSRAASLGPRPARAWVPPKPTRPRPPSLYPGDQGGREPGKDGGQDGARAVRARRVRSASVPPRTTNSPASSASSSVRTKHNPQSARSSPKRERASPPRRISRRQSAPLVRSPNAQPGWARETNPRSAKHVSERVSAARRRRSFSGPLASRTPENDTEQQRMTRLRSGGSDRDARRGAGWFERWRKMRGFDVDERAERASRAVDGSASRRRTQSVPPQQGPNEKQSSPTPQARPSTPPLDTNQSPPVTPETFRVDHLNTPERPGEGHNQPRVDREEIAPVEPLSPVANVPAPLDAGERPNPNHDHPSPVRPASQRVSLRTGSFDKHWRRKGSVEQSMAARQMLELQKLAKQQSLENDEGPATPNSDELPSKSPSPVIHTPFPQPGPKPAPAKLEPERHGDFRASKMLKSPPRSRAGGSPASPLSEEETTRVRSPRRRQNKRRSTLPKGFAVQGANNSARGKAKQATGNPAALEPWQAVYPNKKPVAQPN